MSDKKWYGGGMYSKTPTRGPAAGQEVFYGKVWVPSRRARIAFWLGPGKPIEIKKRLAAIYADPEKALTDRERERVQAIMFGKILDLFLEKYRTRAADGGRRFYESTLEAPREFFGEKPVTAITVEALDRYTASRRDEKTKGVERTVNREKVMVGAGRRKVSDCTLRKEIVAIGTVLKWAKARGLVLRNPVADYEKPKNPGDRTIAALDSDQEGRLLAACPPWARDMIEWAIYSGMRRGEILALRWREIDRAGGVVHVLGTKTGKARVVPLSLSRRLPAILDRHPQRIDSDLVFHEQDGALLDVDRLNGVLEAALKAAGVPKTPGVMWNLLRKTTSTRLYAAGAQPQDEADLLGHSMQIAVRHYRALSAERHRGLAGILDGAPTAPAPENADTGAPVGARTGGAA